MDCRGCGRPLPAGTHGRGDDRCRRREGLHRGHGGRHHFHRRGLPRDLYEQFADKEDCFIAAYGTVMERMLTFVADGFAQGSSDDWVVQIRGGIGALLTYLAENPVAARVGIVEGFGADPGQGPLSAGCFVLFPFLDSARNMVDEPDRIPDPGREGDRRRGFRADVQRGIERPRRRPAENAAGHDVPRGHPYFGHDRGIEAMEETRVSA